MPQSVVREDLRPAPAEGEAFEAEGFATIEGEGGARRVERAVVQTPDGPRLRERVFIAEGPDAALSALQRLLPQALERWRRIHHLNQAAIGEINHELERERLRHREVELRHAEGRVTDAALGASLARRDARLAELREEYRHVEAEVAEIDREDARWRFVIVEPTHGRFAPVRQTEPDEFMRLSQIVRAVPANDLDLAGRLGVYFSRWGEFLGGQPREANTAGGVFPVIFCTVLLTILLSIVVVPLGVIAALYLREYAKQGLIVSAVRVAVNNLAGVPSIVYGVFGLGFFCYTLGRYIDAGPTVVWPKSNWLLGVVGLLVLTAGAVVAGFLARPVPGQPVARRARILAWSGGLLWLGAVALLVALFARSPFFHGFYRARLPSPTFGAKGLLWSALTLALLTLPVVIVATEEAISAVPRTLREGSYGCGASKWQTIQRIVLPRAAPGIMTGAILAMARGAGEVAPLMLVGAVKLAPELPFSSRFPFIHVERSFMHLGFHIYDVGFQSPDSEASRPLAWTTTLLLIVIIAVLNLTAISLRARLRRRFVTGAF
ncbi:MAG: ABC transporter permease subunit [Phycisphaerales bacterium]|nr:ABC transporter permease subunit [Phycisphaerales bacterium]